MCPETDNLSENFNGPHSEQIVLLDSSVTSYQWDYKRNVELIRKGCIEDFKYPQLVGSFLFVR